jgi:hypothetical protein
MYGLVFHLLHISRASCCLRASCYLPRILLPTVLRTPHPTLIEVRREVATADMAADATGARGTLACQRLCLYLDPAHLRLLFPPVLGQAATGGREK